MVRINKAYVVFLIFTAAGFFIEGEIILNLLFYSAVVVFIISLVSLALLYKGVSSKIECEKDVYTVGEEGCFYLTLTNRLFFFVPILFLNCNNKDIKFKSNVVQVGAHKIKKFKGKIILNKRGKYNFSDFTMEIRDIVFINRIVKKLKSTFEVKIYPKIYFINEELFNLDVPYVKNLGNKDSYLIREIRKYSYRDNYKKIHWKISSKAGELYVKEYEELNDSNIKFYIDMNNDILNQGEKIEENYVSLAASILNYFIYKKEKFQIYFGSDASNTLIIRGKEDFSGVMDYFLNNKCMDKGHIITSLEKSYEAISRKDLLCFVVFKVDDVLQEQIEALSGRGIKCIVFCYEVQEYNSHYFNGLDVQYISIKELVLKN